jgi:hypothetical protein
MSESRFEPLAAVEAHKGLEIQNELENRKAGKAYSPVSVVTSSLAER